MRSLAFASVIVAGMPCAILAQTTAPSTQAATQPADFYPEVEPFETGYLKVSDLHEIYYELCGNRKGMPVMMLHGGPGSGSYPSLRRYHDPGKYLIILHDQRGCGRSKPLHELRENNTQNLVEDVERLRKHLRLSKVQVFGGSWGSTLALAYAEAYPESVNSLVLRGIFLGTKWETEHFYHGPVATYFPDVYERLRSIMPQPEKLNYPQQLLDLLRSDDPKKRERAARAWAAYESRISAIGQTDAEVEASLKKWDAYGFSLIENYYMANDCFLKEDQLLDRADKIGHIPTVIVQGRYDVVCPPISAWRLHKAMPVSRLVFVEDAGHSGGAPPMRAALIEAVKSLEPMIGAAPKHAQR